MWFVILTNIIYQNVLKMYRYAFFKILIREFLKHNVFSYRPLINLYKKFPFFYVMYLKLFDLFENIG